jgi:hypothetical protein
MPCIENVRADEQRASKVSPRGTLLTRYRVEYFWRDNAKSTKIPSGAKVIYIDGDYKYDGYEGSFSAVEMAGHGGVTADELDRLMVNTAFGG